VSSSVAQAAAASDPGSIRTSCLAQDAGTGRCLAEPVGDVLIESAVAGHVHDLQRNPALERRPRQSDLESVSVRVKPIVSGCVSAPWLSGSMSAPLREQAP
jgi:hypothetical protein